MSQLSDLKKAMKGVDVALVTPFNADGSLDLEGMRANVRWLIEHATGKDFIFTPVPSTGEFASMSDDECKTVIKLVVEEVNGRAPVMAGGARPGTLETIKMCQYAQSVGADGAFVCLPYYYVPQEEGMYLHYKQIAESVDSNFGIMIYNNPSTSGNWIKPPLMKRLSKIPNIIAVKEDTTDIGGYYGQRRAVDPEDAVILCGQGEFLFSFEALYGCPGFVGGGPNFMPDLLYSSYEAAVARDFDKLSEIIISLEPYYSFKRRMGESHGPHTGVPGTAGGSAGTMAIGVCKAAMDIIGLRGGEPRLPLVGLNNEEKAELSSILRALKIVK